MSLIRPQALQIGNRLLILPIFFPSISSVKTGMLPSEYLEILSTLSSLNKQFLISAYDLANFEDPEIARRLLLNAINAEAIVLMDSGNYESFWKDAKTRWTQSKFHDAIRNFPCDLAFGFDEQEPPSNFEKHVSLIKSRWLDDQNAAQEKVIVPIVHGASCDLAGLCKRVVEETGVRIIAVAERKLGDGIIDRAHTVAAIRKELNDLGRYVALHLLGTGNPISIALYVAMGADSFDGLEWCQTSVDHETGCLFHLSQADFFGAQTEWAATGLSFHASTLAHNLELYTSWMDRLRAMASKGKVIDFCRLNFPDRIYRQCAATFKWT